MKRQLPNMTLYAAALVVLLSVTAAHAQPTDGAPAAPPLGDTAEEEPAQPESAPARVTPARAKQPAASDKPLDTSPVVRAARGNLGLFFRFGGLATLTASGDSQNTGKSLWTNQIGLKLVLSEKYMIPIFFGFGIHGNTPADGDSSTDWNLDLGGGVEYHFRIWRRFSPVISGVLKLGFSDASGGDNLNVHLSLGPAVGVEYYVADRLSLTAQYRFLLRLAYQDSETETSEVTSVQLATQSGGSLTLTFYF